MPDDVLEFCRTQGTWLTGGPGEEILDCVHHKWNPETGVTERHRLRDWKEVR
jgi:hypothetical protein